MSNSTSGHVKIAFMKLPTFHFKRNILFTWMDLLDPVPVLVEAEEKDRPTFPLALHVVSSEEKSML
uniref:(California timema) hypothetical protein n=1 Tax=Timema californicum TaxID=61474 RepID=A0A7R9PAN7_TIMCA|nr:unnamed protein product [Timema californicum]